MLWPKSNSLFSRVMKFLLVLPPGVLALAVLLHLSKAVIAWSGIITLLIVGGEFITIPLGFTRKRLVNDWYRAAYWAGWIVCVGTGALVIGTTVAWWFTGPTLGQFSAVTGVLTAALLVGLVGLFLVGGLAVTGYIVQGNAETRRWSRAWSRRNRETRAGSAEEPPSLSP